MRPFLLTLLAAGVLCLPLLVWAAVAGGSSRDLGPDARRGGLRIEGRPQSARSFNANYGFVRTRFIEFRVLHRDKPVWVPDEAADGKRRSEFRDAWILADAPRPAVLAGHSDALFLIVEEGGSVQVTRIAEAARGVPSVQWLDAPGGVAPPRRIELITLDDGTVVPSRLLSGGRHLLLNGQVDFDVTTLRPTARAVSTELAGYVARSSEPVGVSPSGRVRAMWLRGESNQPHDSAILAIDPDHGTREVLRFDLTETGAPDDTQMPEGWFGQHFRWVAGRDGRERLVARDVQAARGWRTRYEFGRFAPQGAAGAEPRYRLEPATATLVPVLAAAIESELGGKDVGASPSGQGRRFMLSHVPVDVQFDPASQGLTVSSDYGEVLWAQQGVALVGELVDARMTDGRWREHLLPAR
jgi:hypothetical protein